MKNFFKMLCTQLAIQTVFIGVDQAVRTVVNQKVKRVLGAKETV